MASMNDTKWFGLAIIASGAVVIANVAFGVDRLQLVGVLFVMGLPAVVSLRGKQTHLGRTLIFSIATTLVFASALSLLAAATEEGSKSKLSPSDVFIIVAVLGGLTSLSISVGAWLLALVASRYQRKHAALSVGLTLFVVTVSITMEIHEQWKRRQPHVPPVPQMAPLKN
jgi:hypothetical protein